MGAALVAFFLAVGVAAHAFDELHDRPLGTHLSSRALACAGGLALLGATAIGIAGIATVSITLAPFVVFGAAICVAYNLELFGGRFHNDAWFALAWGAFPALTGYWVNALRFSVAGLLVAAACGGFSIVQRRLSTPARLLRRKTASVRGEQLLGMEPLSSSLARPSWPRSMPRSTLHQSRSRSWPQVCSQRDSDAHMDAGRERAQHQPAALAAARVSERRPWERFRHEHLSG